MGSGYISSTASSVDAGGYFTYTTTFAIGGTDGATLSGAFAGDNDVAVYLNGTEIASNLYAGNSYGYGFQGESTFTASSDFVAGLNTLQFVVENGNNAGDTSGPTVLLVSDLSGSVPAAAYPSAAPEPSSMVLLGSGLLAVAGVGRRRFLRA